MGYSVGMEVNTADVSMDEVKLGIGFEGSRFPDRPRS